MASSMIKPTKGALKATVPETIRSPWWIKDPPDFPTREPTPSMAALPVILHSLLSGIKASSFVVSKRVYFEARATQFCSDPKNTQRASGVLPRNVIANKERSLFWNSRKENAGHSSYNAYSGQHLAHIGVKVCRAGIELFDLVLPDHFD